MSANSRAARLLASLQTGIALHNKGLLDEADTIYRSVLKQEARHPDALHLRALVAHAQERYDDATQLAEAAIRAAPHVANLQNTAGDAWRHLGNFDKAMLRLKEAVRLDPQMAMAHHNLSLALLAVGNPTEALQAHRRALELNPGYIEAIASGVEIACALEDDKLAAAMMQRLGNNPQSRPATQAAVSYRTYQARRLLKELKPAEADLAATAATESNPDFWGGWALRAEAQFELGNWDQAVQFAAVAAKLAPKNEDASLNLAVLLNMQKRHGDAEAHLAAWLTDRPHDHRATFALAGAQLAVGNYTEGWKSYESRWQTQFHSGLRAPFPQWAGQPVKSLLIYFEQGLGDSVMMLRFLPEVQRRCGGQVTLQLQPPLQRLAERVFAGSGITVATYGGENVFEAACPLMSLPLVLGANSPDRFLGDAPYLSANPHRTETFRNILGRYPGKKLGVIWQGSTASKVNRMRTLPESELDSITSLPGWTPVSLQHGIKSPVIGMRQLVDLSAEIRDFEDLAALMQAVDAVVSLDSGPVHLAGALGIPTYNLVPWMHDWRWGPASADTAWYSGMMLFRQTKEGDWSLALQQLARHLQGSI